MFAEVEATKSLLRWYCVYDEWKESVIIIEICEQELDESRALGGEVGKQIADIPVLEANFLYEELLQGGAAVGKHVSQVVHLETGIGQAELR